MRSVAEEWDNYWGMHDSSRDSEEDKVLKKFCRGKVLEVGSGKGRIAKKIKAIGLDFSREALKHGGYPRVLGDVVELPFKKNTFDTVFSLGVIEHFDDSLVPILEMKRVLKHGGYIFLTVPNRYNLSRLLYFFKELLKKDKGFSGIEHTFTVDELKSLIENNTNMEMIEVGFLDHIRNLAILSFPFLRFAKFRKLLKSTAIKISNGPLRIFGKDVFILVRKNEEITKSTKN